MKDRKLRIFHEVVKELNMTKVAEKLYISQPAVSQAIHELENELDVRLFDRIGKKLYITYEGELFHKYVRRILNIYDEVDRVIKESKNIEKGKLNIGASTTIGIYILPELIGDFKRKYKGIEVSLIIENTQNIINLLLENKIDFAFVEGPVYSDEIIVEDFCEDELVFIASKNHPWSKLQTIEPEDILKEKVIMRELGSGTREIVSKFLGDKNLEYNMVLELGNTEAIKKAVEADLGVSCISKRCIENEVKINKISSVKINNHKLKRSLTLVYHKDKYMTRVMNSFIKESKEYIKEK